MIGLQPGSFVGEDALTFCGGLQYIDQGKTNYPN
jgi:hypothetical protein